MRKVLLIVLAIILCSCQKDNFEIKILNSSVSTNDSVQLELYNNTNEEYLFYFKNPKLYYNSNYKNTIIADVSTENIPAKIEISSDPLYILNEDGSLTNQDIKELEKYSKLSTKRVFRVVSPQSSIIFTVPFIDSMNIGGGKTYPILEYNKRYHLKIKMDIDTHLIDKKELENIRFKYKSNIKFFHGKLVSKTVKVK
ncbi:MAG: hypothetical protein J6O88_18420 [Chryseobacterium sp.]|uniref:hypothetical protein n=1 Tax=Chryseobacterium sp. TaxID=1871047 RepID=UPI001B2E4639|nr:hypothetical protein [Chryseobacterium sp.]MBO6186635.1 hypothetical protein [Chryseobacterium sp.]